MDQPARQHASLILEDASDRFNGAVAGKIEAMRRTHAARGMLQSGNTMIESIAIIEECASEYISDAVDGVAAVVKDMEAFALIEENIEVSMNAMARKMEDLIGRTFGGAGSVFGELGHRKAAFGQFNEARGRLRRQLELQRFTFTEPYRSTTPAVVGEVPPAAAEKPKGGKPLASHWDEMWATIAVALHVGDLQPKTQADIERAMKDWLASKDINPADSSVRKRAQQLWRKLQEAD